MRPHRKVEQSKPIDIVNVHKCSTLIEHGAQAALTDLSQYPPPDSNRFLSFVACIFDGASEGNGKDQPFIFLILSNYGC